MKKLRLVIFALSVAGFIIVLVYAIGQGGFSKSVFADDDVIKRIEERTKALDTDKYQLLVSYKDVYLPCEEDKHLFYMPLDMENDKWEEFSLSGFLKERDDPDSELIDAQFLFVDDYSKTDKKDAIKKGTEYPFYVVTDEGYIKGSIIFSGMNLISFDVTDEKADDGTNKFMMTVIPSNGNAPVSVKTSASLHGNTSLAFEKKSLRLRLDKNKKLLGLRKDDDWVLNSLYADETRIRDMLCIDLWNDTGAYDNPYGRQFGSDAEYAEVFINGGYQGMYLLMVPIDAKQIGSEKVSKQTESEREVIERLYKKKYTAEWKSDDFIGELPDPAMPDYRGGFYLKGDMILGNEKEWEPMYRMAKLIEGDDETFKANILNEADAESIIDNWLFYQAIDGVDNENKNYYYVIKNDNGKEKGYFIPWDMNLSFGDVYIENDYYSIFDEKALTEEISWEPGEKWIRSGDEEALSLLYEKWDEWRKGTFSDESLKKKIALYEHKVKDSGAFAREMKRYPNGNADEDFDHLYDFATDRETFVDELVKGITGK